MGPIWPMFRSIPYPIPSFSTQTNTITLSLSLFFNGVVLLLRPQSQSMRLQSQVSLHKAPGFLFPLLPPPHATVTPKDLSSHSHSLQKLLPRPSLLRSRGPKSPPLHRSSFSHRLRSPAQVSNPTPTHAFLKCFIFSNYSQHILCILAISNGIDFIICVKGNVM